MAKRHDLTGRVVVITGAARGIGLATARAFRASGCSVALGDVDGDLARAQADQIGGSGHDLDVTDIASFDRFLTEAETALGPIDVVVNNAGIMPIGPLPEEPDAVTQRILAVNLLGAVNGTKLAMTRMRVRGTGHIVNVASAVGRFAVPNAATYSATKFGVVGLTQAVRGELRGSGIEASVVLPAATATELVSGLQNTGPVAAPDDVAHAIIRVVRRPRFETWVPQSNQRSFKVMQMLPYRALEAAARQSPSTRIFLQQDVEARAAYESRARG